jgi:MFS family permease
MIGMGAANSVAQLMLLMPLLWFSTNYYQTVLLAILPDRVPEEDRGFASSAIGLAVPVGLFAGVNLAAFAPTPFVGYALLAVPFVAATIALTLIAPEESSLDWDKVHADQAGSRRSPFLAAFADRDFSLTFASRYLIFLAYYTISSYLFYIVQDYVGASRLPSHSPSAAVSMMMSLITVAWLLITPLTGFVSSGTGRTARVVAATSIAIGIVMLLPAFSGSWTVMLLFGAGIGLTFGVYFAIDIKLAAIVLSSEENSGRDLGILVVAGSGPTVLAPAIAAGIITYASFPALFAFGGLVAIVGGVCAFFIRTQR